MKSILRIFLMNFKELLPLTNAGMIYNPLVPLVFFTINSSSSTAIYFALIIPLAFTSSYPSKSSSGLSSPPISSLLFKLFNPAVEVSFGFESISIT